MKLRQSCKVKAKQKINLSQKAKGIRRSQLDAVTTFYSVFPNLKKEKKKHV